MANILHQVNDHVETNMMMSQKEVNAEYEKIRRNGGGGMHSFEDENSIGLMNYLQQKKGYNFGNQSKGSNRASHGGQFPLISNSGMYTSKARISSGGYMKEFAAAYRGTVLSSSAVSSDDEQQRIGTSPRNADAFTRLNKFKKISKDKQGNKSHDIKKSRYSVNEGSQNGPQSGFSSMMSSQIRGAAKNDLNNPKILQEKKLTATLEEINVLDLVNKGKISQQNQLKPISTKNLNKYAPPLNFEVQKSVGIFKSNENTLNSHRSNTRQLKSVLPQGVQQNLPVLSQSELQKENIISINSKTQSAKPRKISITALNNNNQHPHIRETHSQSMVITENDVTLQSYRNPQVTSLHNSREGGFRNPMSEQDTARQSLSNTLQRKVIGGPQSMLLKLLTNLFEARNEDLDIIRRNEKQLNQFIKRAEANSMNRKLILNDMGFGVKSANVLSQLIKIGSNIAQWTHIDLSMNKLCLNLEPVIKGLKSCTNLVSLRMSNNELGGNQQHLYLLKNLVMEHSSLVELDLSNDDSNQNKNKLGNSGLETIIEGILDSKSSVLTMLNFAQNNIQSTYPETFEMLRALLSVKSDQIISINLSDNDLGTDFISILGHEALSTLKELRLANTKLTKKSLSDFSDMLNKYKFTLLNLDLSSNSFNSEGLFKFLNCFKNNQTIRTLNLSRNDFSMPQSDDGTLSISIPPSYFSIFEQFISMNRSLEELNLSDCKLGTEGAMVIGKSLRRNQKLQRLNLSMNKIGDRGAQIILEGVLDNITTTNSMQGLLQVPNIITDLDLSKNELEFKTEGSKNVLCNLLMERKSQLTSLSLRDNLIRDEAADAICLALKQNLSIMKFQIDMNSIKKSTLIEIKLSVKRNIATFKEKQGPAIKKEFNNLQEERQRVLEDLPIDQQEHLCGKTLIETAMHIDRKATVFEEVNHIYKLQFMEDDRKLDLIREEALRQEKELIEERERMRELRRNADFEDEQMDARMQRQERQWDKSVSEQQQKVEIIRLAQSKTIDERDKLKKELQKKKDLHQVQVDAWNRELAIIMREQAISAMIQESYVKEIDRVKKQQILLKAMEECQNEPLDSQPPTTAGSVGHRFGPSKPRNSNNYVKGGQQRRGNSTLRRMDSNSSQLKNVNDSKHRGSTTIRSSLPAAIGKAALASMTQNITREGSPSSRINELQQMKKQLKREFKQQEQEVEAIQRRQTIQKETQAINNGSQLQRQKTIDRERDRIPHAFRVPAQMNFP